MSSAMLSYTITALTGAVRNMEEVGPYPDSSQVTLLSASLMLKSLYEKFQDML